MLQHSGLVCKQLNIRKKVINLMYEEDYIMRSKTNFIRLLSKKIYGKDIAVYELSENEEYTQNDNLHKRLLALLSEGKINEAENQLFEKINFKDNRTIMIAIDFYQRLNNLDNEFLQANNFSREEIEEGLRDIAKRSGIVIYKL